MSFNKKLLLIGLGIIIGALVFSQFNQSTAPQLHSSPVPEVAAQKQPTPVVPSDKRVISSLRDLNNAFIEIAEAVTPTVVTVSTEQIMKISRSLDPFRFFFEDRFRDFFGERAPRRREQPRQEEFLRRGLGSGVIVSKDGYILTNNHVIDEADSIYIRTIDNRSYPVRVVGTDPRTDIAVLKVEADNLPVIKLGDSNKLRVGEWVMAIGSPFGSNLAHSVTQGIVSGLGRSDVGVLTSIQGYEAFIQTDAAINPGNSGGALVNLDGELVGINTAIATRSGGFQGVGFAIPIDMAREVMDSLIKYGKVVRGWLGISIQPVGETEAKALGLKEANGILVGDTLDDSPASKAGVKAGDVIIALNGQKIQNMPKFRRDVAALKPGAMVTLTVIRNGKEKKIKVTLGEWPEEEEVAQRSEQISEDLLGFRVTALDREVANHYRLDPGLEGVVVIDVDRTSNAGRAGLREGDLIQSVNRRSVRNLKEFNQEVAGLKRGDTLLLHLYRGNGRFFLAFNL